MGSEEIEMISVSPAGTYYIYAIDGRLLAEYNGLGFCVREYLYMGGKLLAEYRPADNRYYYYTTDQIGSTRIVTDQNGVVVYAAAHDPYGGIQQTWESGYDPALKFSGKERDTESGLDYFGVRYYDHTLYRFLSVDPVVSKKLGIANPQFWNSYAYCGNNPLRFFDNDGRSFLIFISSSELLLVFSKAGALVGVYPASNNPSSGNEPFPEGFYKYHHYTKHDTAQEWDSIDYYGFFGFAVNERGSYGVHAGKDGMTDLSGRYGWRYATNGCIRTTNSAMSTIYNLHFNAGDPLEFIIVIRNEQDINRIALSVFLYLFLETDKSMDEINSAVESLRSDLPPNIVPALE